MERGRQQLFICQGQTDKAYCAASSVLRGPRAWTRPPGSGLRWSVDTAFFTGQCVHTGSWTTSRLSSPLRVPKHLLTLWKAHGRSRDSSGGAWQGDPGGLFVGGGFGAEPFLLGMAPAGSGFVWPVEGNVLERRESCFSHGNRERGRHWDPGSLTLSLSFLEVRVLLACLYVHHVYACCLQRPEQGIRSLGSGVKDGCELSCKCWELNAGPLGGQPVL